MRYYIYVLLKTLILFDGQKQKPVIAISVTLQNGNRCFCGFEFGRHGALTSGCNVPCQNSEDLLCGGVNKNYVYRIAGAFLTNFSQLFLAAIIVDALLCGK